MLLKTHGVAADELRCNVLFIVILFGDTSIQTLGQMIQRGNVVIGGILQQETWNTTININCQLIARTSDISPMFLMLVSPTQITMNSTLYIDSSAATPCVLSNTTGANANIDFRYLTNVWNAGMDGGNFLSLIHI